MKRERSDRIDRCHIDIISFFVLVECAHLRTEKERERTERDVHRALLLSLTFSVLSERKKPNERSSVVGERERQTEREREEGIASSSSIVTHRSLSDHFFQNLHFFFLFVCFVYFAERKKRNDVDAEEQRDTNDDD